MRKRRLAQLLVIGAFITGIGVGSLGGDLFAWRVRAYAKKAMGKVPELRWSELLRMTFPTDRYGLSRHFEEGRSLEAVIRNPYNSDADVREGERLFAANCAICHGTEGRGATAPSLRRPSYNRGDSSFAIYRVLRDGIAQTAMVPPPLDAQQRWQMVAYLREIQQDRASKFEKPVLTRVTVPAERLVAAGARTDEWVTYSGRLSGWRYSELAQLTPASVAGLKSVWKREFPSKAPNQVSTPLAIDGRLFVSESPSNVAAIDARTGEFLWYYKHPLARNLPVCCGAVNRGVAALGDQIFLATLSSDLVALDAASGKVRWSRQVGKPEDGYSMTVAPLAYGDLVVTGVSGGEYGMRGRIVAYEAATGRERWRFNTIPAPGEPGHETWGPGDAWRTGGGPTWVTGSYDTESDVLYWGVGNPVPEFQGATRPGDNLYTNSVVALRGKTGQLLWHFQFTPHDEHDWDANQTPILTELDVDGRKRKVICWVNRNGYYYVLDRETGKFLKGAAFVQQNWSAGLDADGRPILLPGAKQSMSGRRTSPSILGGTNWYPPAYDPGLQLVFVHSNEQSDVFTQQAPQQLKRIPNQFYLGSGGVATAEPDYSVRALDAATGKIAWIHHEGSTTDANGVTGMLATAGGLVFGGTGGHAFALESRTGRELWRQFLGGNTQGPPITFSLDGRQVVAFWGGSTLNLFSL